MNRSLSLSFVALSFLMSLHSGLALADSATPKTAEQSNDKPSAAERDAAKAALQPGTYFSEGRGQLTSDAAREEQAELPSAGVGLKRNSPDVARAHRHGQTAMARDRIESERK